MHERFLGCETICGHFEPSNTNGLRDTAFMPLVTGIRKNVVLDDTMMM